MCGLTELAFFRSARRRTGFGRLADTPMAQVGGVIAGFPGGLEGPVPQLALCGAYVGVTDNNWYRFLADRPGVTEVNFWQPSGAREFRVLAGLGPAKPAGLSQVWRGLVKRLFLLAG
jgi:hypothetical protein